MPIVGKTSRTPPNCGEKHRESPIYGQHRTRLVGNIRIIAARPEIPPIENEDNRTREPEKCAQCTRHRSGNGMVRMHIGGRRNGRACDASRGNWNASCAHCIDSRHALADERRPRCRDERAKFTTRLLHVDRLCYRARGERNSLNGSAKAASAADATTKNCSLIRSGGMYRDRMNHRQSVTHNHRRNNELFAHKHTKSAIVRDKQRRARTRARAYQQMRLSWCGTAAEKSSQSTHEE